MGEAKRRKQLLGSRYGKPLNLSAVERRELIQTHLEFLLLEHYQACGYTEDFNTPNNPQFRYSSSSNNDPEGLSSMLDELVQHWQKTFNSEFIPSALAQIVKSIQQNRGLFLHGTNLDQLAPREQMEPIIALPQARSYFLKLLAKRQVSFPLHYDLVIDVLTVLSTPSAETLLKRLILHEFNDFMDYAQSQRPDWIANSLTDDGWIDLNQDVMFQAANSTFVGLLTLIVTLPWENQLSMIEQES